MVVEIRWYSELKSTPWFQLMYKMFRPSQSEIYENIGHLFERVGSAITSMLPPVFWTSSCKCHLMDSHVLDFCFLFYRRVSRPSSIFRLPIVSLIFFCFPFQLCVRARGLFFSFFFTLVCFSNGKSTFENNPKRSDTITVVFRRPTSQFIYI